MIEGKLLLQRDDVIRTIDVHSVFHAKLRTGITAEGIALRIGKANSTQTTILTEREALWLAHALLQSVRERDGDTL